MAKGEHPIFDEFFRQRSDLVEADKLPRTVVFSQAGYPNATKELHRNDLGHNETTGPSPTYCGLHRCTDSRPNAPEIVVTDLTQAEYFAPRPRQVAITLSTKFDAGKLQMLADDQPVGEPITLMHIAGSKLTAAQLCEIIRAWLDSDDATHWGAFERSLNSVLELHGRFE